MKEAYQIVSKDRRKGHTALVEADKSLEEIQAYVKESTTLREATTEKRLAMQKDYQKKMGDLDLKSYNLEKEARGDSYRSSHWDESNVLYHVRKQDTTIGKQKTLLIEEIQSDWHQAGRKEGYVGKQDLLPEDTKTLLEMRRKVAKEHPLVVNNSLEEIQTTMRKDLATDELIEAKKRYDLLLPVNAKHHNYLQSKKIPQAPYSKTWHEKAMKDQIQEAVDNGYEKVAWVMGKEQADRYSLSKQIDSLAYNKDKNELMFWVNGKAEAPLSVKPEKLADHVGKEMAEKITSSKSNNPAFQGVDLEIGGEGMKTFYDKMLPKWTDKYVKKFGSKVEVKELDNGQKVWSFDVTPKMKEDVTGKGQALYSHGAGAIAGVEEDEEGNIEYNVAKGLLGAAGVMATMAGVTKLHSVWKKGKLKNVTQFPDETKLQIFQRAMQDKFNRVKQLQEFKTKGGTLPETKDAYLAEELFSGKTQERLVEFDKNIVDPILLKTAKAKISIDDIDEYLHARHATERNKKMLELNGIEDGSGMSNAKANEILAKWAGNKAIEDIASDVYTINRNRLKMFVNEGLESEDFVKGIEDVYDNYVPLQREMDSKSFSGGTGKGFDIKGKETKRAKGSQRKVESPLMHSIMASQETIIRAEKNKVGKAFLDFAEQFPDDTLYTVSSLKHMPRFDKHGAIVTVDPKYKLSDNVLHVKVDGKIKEIEFHDHALASAFKNLNATEMNVVMKHAHKAVRFLAGLNTQWNPEFVISNFERDVQTALVNLPDAVKPNRAQFMADIPGAIRGIYRAERGKDVGTEWQKLFNEMKKEGGTTGWMEQYDLPQMADNLNSKLEKLQGKNKIKEGFKSTLEFIDNVNTSVENGVRLVAYKQAKKAGLSNKKAASIAKNLTVNFNRKGELGTFMNTAYMFYNASIQGSVRMVQALKSSKKAQALAGGIMAGAVGLHYYNESVNKEAYDLIQDWEKDTNYILMNEDGTYTKIKVPYGYNIFKTMGDLTAQVASGDLEKDKVSGRILSAMVNAFSPVGSSTNLMHTATPTLAKPIYEVEQNVNFFGAPIKPKDTPFQPDNLAEAHKHYKSVNPVAKYVAQGLNEATGGTKHLRGDIDISPEFLEHIAEFVSGGLGKTVMRTADTATKAIQGKEQEINKVPIARAFRGKVREKAGLHEAYNLLKVSGNTIISDRNTKKFNSLLFSAFKKKQIDFAQFNRMKTTFTKAQAKVKWSKDNDVQDYKDLSMKDIREGIKAGLSKTDMRKIIKAKTKDK